MSNREILEDLKTNGTAEQKVIIEYYEKAVAFLSSFEPSKENNEKVIFGLNLMRIFNEVCEKHNCNIAELIDIDDIIGG
jgi:hypothetical protein